MYLAEDDEEAPWAIFKVFLNTDRSDKRLRRRNDSGIILEANNLYDHPVTNASKQWACEAISGKHEDHPAWKRIGIEGGTRRSRTEFQEMFGLTASQLTYWFKLYKEGELQKNPEAAMQKGRPRIIDEKAMARVMANVRPQKGAKSGAKLAMKRKNTAQMMSVFQEAVQETATRRGKSKLKVLAAKPPSKSTLSLYRREYNLNERVPQPQFEARQEALKDPFLIIAWVAIMIVFFGHLPGFKKFNIDFSMVKVLPPGAGRRVWYCTEEEAEAIEAGERFVLQTAEATGTGNAVFVKYAVLAEFCGSVAPMVVILAVDGMPEDGFLVEKVLGLSYSNEVTSFGYLIFVPRRAGNAASNKWLHEEYICKHIAECDARNAHLPGGDMKSAVYFDSEHGPLEAAMQTETLQMYRDQEIYPLRGVVSGTSEHQLLDKGPIFMGIHATVASVARNSIDVKSDALRSHLDVAFEKLKMGYPTAKVTAGWKEQARHGVEVLVHAVQANVTGAKIREAGALIGQHVRVGETPSYLHPGYEKTTVDAMKILSLCTTEFSDGQVESILTNLPEMVDVTRNKGRLTMELIENLTGIKRREYKDRDGAPLGQSLPSCLTCVAEEERYRQYKKDRDPEEIKKKKQQAAVRERAEKILNDKKKKEDKAAARAATLAATQARHAQMTKAQIAQEKKEAARVARAKAARLRQVKKRREEAMILRCHAVLNGEAENFDGIDDEGDDADEVGELTPARGDAAAGEEEDIGADMEGENEEENDAD
jgi:hypothetical protein